VARRQNRDTRAAIRPSCSSARRRSAALMIRSAWYCRLMSYIIIVITSSPVCPVIKTTNANPPDGQATR
jgi:uncharacterized membrane protein